MSDSKITFCYRTRLDEQSWSTEPITAEALDIQKASQDIVEHLRQSYKNVHVVFRVPADLQASTARILFYKAEKDELTCTNLGSMLPKHKLDKVFLALQEKQSLKDILLSL